MRQFIFCFWVIWLFGCGDVAEPPPEFHGETRRFVDIAHADSVTAWKVKAPSMSMWLDAEPKVFHAHNQVFWSISGRASKNIKGIKAFVAGRRYLKSKVVSARKFELLLSGREMARVLSGELVFLEFEPEAGPHDYYAGMIRIEPQVRELDGTDRLWIESGVVPVLTSSGVKLRLRVMTEPGFSLQYVFTDDDQEPEVTFNPGWEWWVDWSPESLQFVADFPQDPVYFYIHDGADSQYRKTASIRLRVVEAGLSILPPEDAWPDPPCDKNTNQCLTDLPSSAFDTFECGTAIEVQACLRPEF